MSERRFIQGDRSEAGAELAMTGRTQMGLVNSLIVGYRLSARGG